MSTDRVVVALRVVVAHPPAGPGTRFGIQDKSGAVHSGSAESTDSETFEIEVHAARGGTAPNFLGPFAHGKPKARFLYLSHARERTTGWVKRIKIALSSITWALIESAEGAVIECNVDGRSAGSVPAAWHIAPRRTIRATAARPARAGTPARPAPPRRP